MLLVANLLCFIIKEGRCDNDTVWPAGIATVMHAASSDQRINYAEIQLRHASANLDSRNRDNLL